MRYLIFNRTASSGVIYRGQSTPMITLGGFGNGLTVTVEVQGLPRGRSNTVSCSMVWCRISARKFDEYGNLAFNTVESN